MMTIDPLQDTIHPAALKLLPEIGFLRGNGGERRYAVRKDGHLCKAGGWGEIRTHGELAPTPVFKTGALNHSATHPQGIPRGRITDGASLGAYHWDIP